MGRRGPCAGYFNSTMKTAPIPITGLSANTIFLKFDSSWDYERLTTAAARSGQLAGQNNQTALITVSYDGGAETQILKWDSNNGQTGGPRLAFQPTFHDTTYNEPSRCYSITRRKTNVVIKFALAQRGKRLVVGLDNIQVSAGPAITTQPASIVRDAGTTASF